MKPLKILDLFSGIGTFSYAFEQVKQEDGSPLFETAAFCEIDKDAHRVLRKHWPNTPIFTDVSQVFKSHIYAGESYLQQHWDESGTPIECTGEIDIIVGGFPCTDISVAGKQKGLFDEQGNKTRSGLWVEYKRLIQEIKPKYVIIENVRNLLSNGIGTVLQDLSEIGYDAEWEVISARDVGQCHLRERLWIVAYPNGSTIRHIPKWAEAGRIDIQPIRETELRHISKTGTPTNPNDDRRLESLSASAEIERESLQSGRISENGSTESSDSSSIGRVQCEGQSQEIQQPREPRVQREEGEQSSLSEPLHSSDSNEYEPTDSYNFRFWPAFTTEEEKSEWWSEATSQFRDWRKAQPELCGVYDGSTTGLHEKFRRARIKQLGNGIVRSIAQLHAERIKYHELDPAAYL